MSTIISSPAGFFWSDIVTPESASDLQSVLVALEASGETATAAAMAAANSATSASTAAASASTAASNAVSTVNDAVTLAEATISASVTSATTTLSAAAATASSAASAASTSASGASSSATSAASSATSAGTSETNAASSASSAGGSATAASTSASNAATSATAAAASAVSAATAVSSAVPLAGGVMTGTLTVPTLKLTSGNSANINLGGTKVAVSNANLGFITGNQVVNSGTITGAFAPFNILQVTEGVTVASGSGQGFYVQLNTGGAGAKGGRNAIQADSVVYATTGNGTPAGQYTAVQGNFFGRVSDTNGIGYGANFTAQLSNASTGYKNIVGQENNVGIQSSCAAEGMTGIQVVGFGNGTVPGTGGYDSAYAIGHQPGFVGFDYGFRISGISSQFPIKTTGTVLGIYAGSPANGGTVAAGVDFTNLTITGNAFKSTGFSVDGAGKVVGATVKSTGGIGAFGTTPPTSKPTISGSRGSATATVLAGLLTALAAAGLITDSTTA